MCSSEVVALNLLLLSCPRGSEVEGTAPKVCACYSNAIEVSASVYQLCPACGAVEAERSSPVGQCHGAGDGGCERQDRACGCRGRVDTWLFCFCKISGSHARGAPGKSKHWFSEVGTPGVGQEKQSRGSICAAAAELLRLYYSHQHAPLLGMSTATVEEEVPILQMKL